MPLSETEKLTEASDKRLPAQGKAETRAWLHLSLLG
jgi:hypothetical protein